MWKTNIIPSLILGLLLLSACTQNGPQINEQPEVVTPCNNIKVFDELTYEMSYCQGDMCTDVYSREECESIDVVVEDDVIKAGQDGKPDCEWIEGEDTFNACRPNK